MMKDLNQIWQDYFTTPTGCQAPMEQMAALMNQSMNSILAFSQTLGEFGQFEVWNQCLSGYLKMCQDTSRDFQTLFMEYLDQFGWIPKSEHLEVIRQYETLDKQIVAERKSSNLLKQSVVDQKNEISAQQTLIEKQKKELTNHKRELTRQKNIVADQQKALAEHQERLTAQEQELAEQKKRIDQQTLEIGEQKRQIEQQAAKLQKQEQLMAEQAPKAG